MKFRFNVKCVMRASAVTSQAYPGDGLSNLICEKCMTIIWNRIEFVEKCENNQKQLFEAQAQKRAQTPQPKEGITYTVRIFHVHVSA